MTTDPLFLVNLTVPAETRGTIVAVYITAWPMTAGLTDDDSDIEADALTCSPTIVDREEAKPLIPEYETAMLRRPAVGKPVLQLA